MKILKSPAIQTSLITVSLLGVQISVIASPQKGKASTADVIPIAQLLGKKFPAYDAALGKGKLIPPMMSGQFGKSYVVKNQHLILIEAESFNPSFQSAKDIPVGNLTIVFKPGTTYRQALSILGFGFNSIQTKDEGQEGSPERSLRISGLTGSSVPIARLDYGNGASEKPKQLPYVISWFSKGYKNFKKSPVLKIDQF